MFLEKYKTIGILGGMGPDATVDFYSRIIRNTNASTDQEHIPVLIFSNPKIPDRTTCIETGNSDTISQYLSESAKILETGGADFISIPCNTVHYYFENIKNSVEIPVMHIIDETVNFILKEYPQTDKINLIGTNGTMKTGLYQERFNKVGIETFIPEENIQNNYVMKAIYGIKSGGDLKKARELLISAAKILSEQSGSELVVLGCTEIPLVFNGPVNGLKIVNPTEVLAKKAVELALK